MENEILDDIVDDMRHHKEYYINIYKNKSQYPGGDVNEDVWNQTVQHKNGFIEVSIEFDRNSLDRINLEQLRSRLKKLPLIKFDNRDHPFDVNKFKDKNGWYMERYFNTEFTDKNRMEDTSYAAITDRLKFIYLSGLIEDDVSAGFGRAGKKFYFEDNVLQIYQLVDYAIEVCREFLVEGIHFKLKYVGLKDRELEFNRYNNHTCIALDNEFEIHRRISVHEDSLLACRKIFFDFFRVFSEYEPNLSYIQKLCIDHAFSRNLIEE